jgi:TolB protein
MMTGIRAVGLALAAAALLASCQGMPGAQNQLPRIFELPSGLIAYIAEDGNVSVIDQTGGGKRALTSDATRHLDMSTVYLAPTWSPDGKQVAFARYSVNAAGSVTEAALFADSRDGSKQRRLLNGSRLQPFYLYWAPDSRRLSLLSQVKGDSSLEMGIATPGAEGDYQALDRGAPFYWDWRPDGSSVVVHTNIGGETERLSLLDPSGASGSLDLGVTGGYYQAPGFSPDGKNVAYVSSAESTFTLHLRGLAGGSDRELATGDGGAFFSFSRDGKRFAYLAAFSMQPLPLGRLTVMDLAGDSPPRTLSEQPVISFFWSPDGRTIAFLTPERGESTDPMFMQNADYILLRLMGFDIATGRTWLVASFPPTRGMLALIPYFDQYNRSATIWSPDSRFIAFTAIAAIGSPAVFVAPADGKSKPRFLAAGDNAFWSWK